VNGDSLCPAEVGDTKSWTIGKHPITGKRVADTADVKIFEGRIGG